MTTTPSTSPPAPDRTPQGWDHVAEAYDAYIVPYFGAFAEDAFDLVALRPGERVLDVASGPGTMALAAARRGADVLATDFAPAMVARLRENARRAGLRVRAEIMDAQRMGVAPASFDVVSCGFGLMFFPDRLAALREMRRAVREGGRIVVTTWGFPDRIEWVATLNDAMGRAAPDVPRPREPPLAFSLGDADALAGMLREAGFRDARVETREHEWPLPDPAGMWRALTTSNPVLPALLERLGPEVAQRARVELEAEFARLLRAGRTGLRGEALLARARA